MAVPSSDRNPLIFRYVRTRLLRESPVPSIVVVVIVCLLIVVLGHWINAGTRSRAEETGGVLFYVLFAVAGAILAIMGAARVSGAVLADRNAGNLDALRLTPTRPEVYLAGYLFGAPVREFVMAAVVLPFLGYTAIVGSVPPGVILRLVVLLASTSVILYLAATVTGLALSGALLRKPRNHGVGLVLLLLFLIGPLTGLIQGLAKGGDEEGFLRMSLFGAEVSSFVYTLIVEAYLGVFLAIAACRKLEREEAPALAKPQALTFYALLHLLLLATFWKMLVAELASGAPGMSDGLKVLVPACAALLLVGAVVGLWLVTLMIPSRSAYRRAQRRAARGTVVPPDAEGAGHVPWGFALSGVTAGVYVVLLIVSKRGGLDLSARAGAYAIPPLLFAAFVAGYGASLEFFTLRRKPRSAMAYQAMAVAVHWIVPLIVAFAVSAFGAAEQTAWAVAAASPLAAFPAAFSFLADVHHGTGGEVSFLGTAVGGLAVQIVVAVTFLALLRSAQDGIRRECAAGDKAGDGTAVGER